MIVLYSVKPSCSVLSVCQFHPVELMDGPAASKSKIESMVFISTVQADTGTVRCRSVTQHRRLVKHWLSESNGEGLEWIYQGIMLD